MVPLHFVLLLLALQALKGFNIDTDKTWVSSVASPHLGHQVLQHSDKQQNWILATSLEPGKQREMYKCRLQDELHCEVANFEENVQKLKSLRAGIAIAQSSEQIMACLQQRRRQKRQVIEELNGICLLFEPDFRKKAFINLTDIIEAELTKGGEMRKRRSDDKDSFDSTHINGFHPTATSHKQEDVHSCKGGSCTMGSKMINNIIINNNSSSSSSNNNNMMEEEAEDDSDLWTEIAIILDGSGSIEPEDFQQAKDFISNMIKIVHEKCSECAFALVQYGLDIQTEFDLREGRDVSIALRKIQAMMQVGRETWTASAIKHVLDNIFSANSGSLKNAAKIIVVLTDGEILLDPNKLEPVIHSDKMEGIKRYAIGVGNAFNKPKALQELRLIASDPDEKHLFRVSNYSALNVLLSTLQQKIIGLEGMAGDILQFELAQSGFSVHFLDERYILLGAVGAFDWAGGVFLYDTANQMAVFLNETTEVAGAKNSYLGYSVGSIHTRCGSWIVAGAPRHSMTGRVLIFDGEERHLKQSLQGEQIGSYFGSEICQLDINRDGLTDYLMIGAPFFHIFGEEGKVYLYHLDQEINNFTLAGHLHGHLAFAFARFGFVLAVVGDINQDGFNDVAVGAPLEEQGLKPGSFGTIYIFNGGRSGILSSFSQRITASQAGTPGLAYFGRSLAGGLDFTGDGFPDIVVGSLGNVVLLRSRPVIQLEPTMVFNPGKISDFYNSSIIIAKLCFSKTVPQDTRPPGLQDLLIRYTVELDVEMERKRDQFEDLTTIMKAMLYTGNSCAELELYIPPCDANCFSNILLKLTYQLHDPKADQTYPVPMLDIYQKSEVYFQLPYADDCDNKTVCGPCLNLTIHTEKEIVVGSTKELSMRIHLENTGNNSYMTSLRLEFQANLIFKTIQKSLQVSSPHVECSESQTASLLNSYLICKIGHPVFKTPAADFLVIWHLDGKKFPSHFTTISLSITNANENSTALNKEYVLHVKYALSVILSRPLPLMYISARDGLRQYTRFTFNIMGKKPFGAQLQLQIWVPALLDGHQVTNIKNAVGTQNATVCNIERVFGQDVWADSGPADPQTHTGIKFHQVNCIIFSEKEEVTVTAELPLTNSVQDLKNGNNLVVRGELTYNKNVYVDPNSENHKAEIRVILLKEEKIDITPVVIKSSFGGFALLIIIIVILYKRGFFKKNYQKMTDSNNELTDKNRCRRR